MKKRIIWSNIHINKDDWKEIAEENGWNEDELQCFIDEELTDYWNTELENLNVPLDGRVIAIADLGLWMGRRQGYRILGRNANSIFNVGEDYNEYYSDGYNIKATCKHHDGVNYIEYRVIREDRDIYNLLNDICNGNEITRRKLNYYTRSLLPYVAKVYGL